MIKQIFDEIAAEPGSNKKMEILSSYKDNELLRQSLYLACSKRVKFWIKQIPEYKIGEALTTSTLEYAISELSILSSRIKTGHDGINHLKQILESLSADDAYIIERIIDKDCKIGMGTSNINKVFPKLIEDTPYMGAKAYDMKLVNKIFDGGKKAFSQIKADGRYCNAIIRHGEVELESRQGEPTVVHGAKFLEELSNFENCVLNGELIMKGLPRYESNGIIASLVSIGKKKLDGEDVTKEIAKFEDKHMGYQEALDRISYMCWDTITIEEYFDGKSNVPYHTRLENLKILIFNSISTMVHQIDGRLVSSVEEALEHFRQALENNEEGTILKAYDGLWKDGKPTTQVKLKKEMNLDLRVTGFNYGTGKNAKLISSVNTESSDGLLKTSPTGMKEDVMKYVTENQEVLLGSILEIKCSGVSKDTEGSYSVLHPVYKHFRTDKSFANSLEECIEIDKGSNFL